MSKVVQFCTALLTLLMMTAESMLSKRPVLLWLCFFKLFSPHVHCILEFVLVLQFYEKYIKRKSNAVTSGIIVTDVKTIRDETFLLLSCLLTSNLSKNVLVQQLQILVLKSFVVENKCNLSHAHHNIFLPALKKVKLVEQRMSGIT